MNEPIAHFEELLKTVPKRLVDLADDAVSHKPAPNRWSKKEILGHLIDSAANNHQRFVRAQSTPRLEFPGYEQESGWPRKLTPRSPGPIWSTCGCCSIVTCCTW